jgi:hypothetical protein
VNPNEEQRVFDEEMLVLLEKKLDELNALGVDDPPLLRCPFLN